MWPAANKTFAIYREFAISSVSTAINSVPALIRREKEILALLEDGKREKDYIIPLIEFSSKLYWNNFESTHRSYGTNLFVVACLLFYPPVVPTEQVLIRSF